MADIAPDDANPAEAAEVGEGARPAEQAEVAAGAERVRVVVRVRPLTGAGETRSRSCKTEFFAA